MRQLGEFLIKYRNLGLGEKLSKELFVETVNNLLGKGVLKLENVTISGSSVKVRAESALRSEIFLRKEEILKQIREKVGGNSSGAVRHIR